MKIAASDFDGTLYHEGKGISEKTLSAIKKWQAAGHKFGLVTGRNMHLVRIGLKGYDIKLDFCVGLNGAVIFDEAEKEIFSREMPQEAVMGLWAHEIASESPYVMTLRGYDSFGKWNDRSCIDPVIHANTPEVTPEEAQALPHILQMCFVAASPERAAQLAADISSRFAGQLSAEANLAFVDVCAAGNNKGTGLEHLQEVMGWQDYPLYVIGDDLNDLSMIEKFHGFAMASGHPLVLEKARGAFASVGEMLEANL
jgi:Cof subfamily protein (haloacid dehalogenase superfamily)